MCSGDVNGYIPIKYFKEIKNIHTGEQIEFNINTPKQDCKAKSLSVLAQGFFPNSKTTPKDIIETVKTTQTNSTTAQIATKYCGEAYNEIQSRKNIISEQREYNKSLPTNTKINTVMDIPIF